MNKIMFYTMTMNSGGAERVIANLANDFVNDNIVSIATLTNNRVDYELKDNIVFYHSSKKNNNNIFNRIKSIKRLFSNTVDFNPNVIIAFCPTMCFIACFLKKFSHKFRNIRLIISERNNPSSEYKNFLTKVIANYLYSTADVIVFQNNGAKDFFNKSVQSKSVIIPNPINENFYNIDLKTVKKENCIVNVGRLEEQKNQELLITACHDVFKKYPNWKLKIYGEGSLKNKLDTLIKKLGNEHNIELLGRCSHLEKILPKCKIFVLSSNYEGMPNSLMEAMVCKLSCISTDCPCGGPKELIINGKNGLLVSVDNLEEMTDAITKMIEKPLFASDDEMMKYQIQNIMKLWRKIIK